MQRGRLNWSSSRTGTGERRGQTVSPAVSLSARAEACKRLILSGERGRSRTSNLLIKSQLLYQLSYAPKSHSCTTFAPFARGPWKFTLDTSSAAFCVPAQASSRSKARLTACGAGHTQSGEIVAELCRATLMIVKASSPASPERVRMASTRKCNTNRRGLRREP